jgi:hypothetical protein
VLHNVPVSNRFAIVIILVSLVVLANCNRGHKPVVPKREISAAEYEVLTAWIDAKISDGHRGEKWTAKVLAIFDITDADYEHLLKDDNGRPISWEKMAESLRKRDPALQQTTLDAFRKVNRLQALVRRSLHPSIDYELVSSAQLEPIFCYHCGFWPAYYKQFPGSQGLLTFSGVGFSVDGTQAFFYFNNRCEGLCGTGDYVIMEKHDGRWVIQKEINMWVS